MPEELTSVTATKVNISDQSTTLSNLTSAYNDLKIFLNRIGPNWNAMSTEEKEKALVTGKFDLILYAKTIRDDLDKWFEGGSI